MTQQMNYICYAISFTLQEPFTLLCNQRLKTFSALTSYLLSTSTWSPQVLHMVSQDLQEAGYPSLQETGTKNHGLTKSTVSNNIFSFFKHLSALKVF